MYYVGIDIGSTASKVVVLGDKELKFVLPTGWSSKEAAAMIKDKLLAEGIDVENKEQTKVVAITKAVNFCLIVFFIKVLS